MKTLSIDCERMWIILIQEDVEQHPGDGKHELSDMTSSPPWRPGRGQTTQTLKHTIHTDRREKHAHRRRRGQCAHKGEREIQGKAESPGVFRFRSKTSGDTGSQGSVKVLCFVLHISTWQLFMIQNHWSRLMCICSVLEDAKLVYNMGTPSLMPAQRWDNSADQLCWSSVTAEK